MCGRFLLDSDIEDILRSYNYVTNLNKDLVIPKGEIFPGSLVPIITQDKELKLCKWGFSHRNSKNLIINGRAETIFEKPTFKKSMLDKRCIIPANCFYEWKGEKGKKEKFTITLKEKKLFSMAAIYNSFTNELGEDFEAFIIITTEANEDMSLIHNRMPVIFHRNAELTWLDKETHNLSQLMHPYFNGALNITSAAAAIQTSLF
ncbi:MAG: SOS response-associated peptidase [Bacillota bacterium]|nr:SOS response-associated peptidase [Bacillota bacterium]